MTGAPQYPTPGDAARVRGLARQALVGRLAQVSGVELDEAGRARELEHIICTSIPPEALDVALTDVSAGDGGELRPAPKGSAARFPRFHSYRSSCALAVNAFGPWRTDPSNLRAAGLDRFTDLQFETKLPISGVGKGKPPNLDVVAKGPTTLAIESKFLEHLDRAKPAKFAPVYEQAVSQLADPSWQETYAMLIKEPQRYRHFGAGQVVKHYLGLKSSALTPARLVYLFWEPLDHAAYPLFAAHRWEAEHFASQVTDSSIEFASMAYHELFAAWAAQPQPPALADHVGCLRRRYEVRLGQ